VGRSREEAEGRRKKGGKFTLIVERERRMELSCVLGGGWKEIERTGEGRMRMWAWVG
jgi:hypothetical protein